MVIQIIAAMDDMRGIGKCNKIPWHIPSDLRFFKSVTSGDGSVVVMGRKTWESLPRKPLLGRGNYVLSTTVDKLIGATCCKSLSEFFNVIPEDTNIVSIIGGSLVYQEALLIPNVRILLTKVVGDYNADTFFPVFEDRFELFSKREKGLDNGFVFHHEEWARKEDESIS